MRSFLWVCALVLVVFAQNEPTSSTSAPASSSDPAAPAFDQSILVQVKQERDFSKKYLDLVLKTKFSQFNAMAGSLIVQNFATLKKEKNIEEIPFGQVPQEISPEQRNKNYLLSTYYMLSAINIKSLQTVFGASDIQEQFYADRVLSLAIQTLGAAVPQPLVQYAFMKQTSTYLKTLKLSYALQVISHWRMWLEDALEVGEIRVSSPNEAYIQSQKSALIRDRLFAFSSFQTYAQIDLQIFFVEAMLAQTEGQLVASSFASMGPSSFLEEQSVPFVSSSQSPESVAMFYRYYFVLFQTYAAQSGLNSAVLSNAALKEENSQKRSELNEQSRQLFGNFGQSLLISSQVEYVSAIVEVTALFGAFGGSLGGSLGGAFVPPAPVAVAQPDNAGQPPA